MELLNLEGEVEMGREERKGRRERKERERKERERKEREGGEGEEGEGEEHNVLSHIHATLWCAHAAHKQSSSHSCTLHRCVLCMWDCVVQCTQVSVVNIKCHRSTKAVCHNIRLCQVPQSITNARSHSQNAHIHKHKSICICKHSTLINVSPHAHTISILQRVAITSRLYLLSPTGSKCVLATFDPKAYVEAKYYPSV